jgi:hypothetical protein
VALLQGLTQRLERMKAGEQVEVCEDQFSDLLVSNLAVRTNGVIIVGGGESMELAGILADIHALEEELLNFERKYGLRSETFYAAYISGEEPENDEWVLDFGEWASVYRTWLTRQADYRNEVQRIQRHTPSLAGLVRVAG